jgi:hypothetical protein
LDPSYPDDSDCFGHFIALARIDTPDVVAVLNQS